MTTHQVAVEILVFGPRGFAGSRMFTLPSIAIGRDPDSDVHLDDPSVSLKHAVLYSVGEGYCIKDAGSRTGTLVNGMPASLSPVGPLDEITLGAFRLRVTVHKAVASQSAPPGGADDGLFVPTPLPPRRPRAAAAPRGGVDAPNGARAPKASAKLEDAGDEIDRLLAEGSRLDAVLAEAGIAPEPWRAREAPAPVASGLTAKSPPSSRAEAPAPGRPRMPPIAETVPLAWTPAASPVAPLASPLAKPVEQPLANPLSQPLSKPLSQPLAPPIPPLPPPSPPPRHPAAAMPPREALGPLPAPRTPPRGPGPCPFPNPNPPITPAAPPAPPSTSVPLQSAAAASTPPSWAGAATPTAAESRPRAHAAAVSPAAPAAPSPRVFVLPPRDPNWSDDDEDDEDDEAGPAFDLIGALLERGLSKGATVPSSVEIVHAAGDHVISVRHLSAGASLKIPGSSVVVGSVGRDGTFTLNAASGSFTVRQDGRELLPHEASALVVAGKLSLVPGRLVTVPALGDEVLIVHLVARAPALPPARGAALPTRDQLTATFGSAFFHIALLITIGVAFLGKEKAVLDLNEGRFATIAVKDIELEPPPPQRTETPRAEKAPRVKDAPSTPQPPQVHARPTSVARASGPASPHRSDAPDTPAPSASKILSVLDSSSPKVGSATTITNLDAAPRVGAGGGFKISGPIGKAPGDSLQVASAGDPHVGTKSASELGKVGRVEGQAPSNGPVRARVSAVPQAVRGEGHLDRGEIQRVVNAHVHQVQGCYERQLMKDPSLAGKITVEWVIDLSGGVSGVRIKQSSVRGVEVASCIQSAVQTWRFPAPQGGTVTVTYPFAFSTLGN